MKARWVTAMMAGVLLGSAGCGGSTTTIAARSSPTPVEDCRGSTETAPGATTVPNVHYVSLTVDHKLRDYRLFRPPALDTTKPVPLVIMLHGSPVDAAGFESLINFDGEAATAGFLYAAPNGCGGLWPYADRAGPATADEDFIGKMIDQLKTEFPIDTSRVFAVGASAGSWMAYRLACDLSKQVVAIVSIAGTMRLSDACQPARPVSILEMHGTLDNQHPWGGGGPHAAFPVDSVMQRWVSLDGCVGGPTITQTGITVTSTWNHCSGTAAVRLDKVVGGHHTWFGSDFDPVPGEPNANATIWSFFNGLKQRT